MERQHLITLRQILVERFSESGLRDLYFHLGLGYDILPGASQRDKARELIEFCERRGHIPQLIEMGRQLRPDISWPTVPPLPPPPDIAEVMLVLKGDHEKFTKAMQDNLISALSFILNTPAEQIRVLRVAPGSVLVILEMPEQAAKRLFSMFLADAPELQRFDIEKVELRKNATSNGKSPSRQPSSEAEKNGTGLDPWRPALLGILGFLTGVLGNLLAAWIQQDVLDSTFTPLRLTLILLLTVLSISAGIWAPRKYQTGTKLLAIVPVILAASIIMLIIAVSGTETAWTFTYQVRAQAKGTGEYISDAIVRIEISGKAPLNDVTDSYGIARILIDDSYKDKPGRLIVEATGYKNHVENIDLDPDALPDVIQLEPHAIAKVTATPHVTPIAPPPTTVAPPAETATATATPTSTPSATLTPTPDCSDVRVEYLELDLATGTKQRKDPDAFKKVILTRDEIRDMAALSGQAILTGANAADCTCYWEGRTNRAEAFEPIGGMTCSFSIQIPDLVSVVYLRLELGGQPYLFTLRVG